MKEQPIVAPKASVIVDGENYFWWFFQKKIGSSTAKRILKSITKGYIRSESSAIYVPKSWRPNMSGRHDMWPYIRDTQYLLPIRWCQDGFQAIDEAILSQLESVDASTLFFFSGDQDFEPALDKFRHAGNRVIMVSARSVINHTYYNKEYEIIHYDDLISK